MNWYRTRENLMEKPSKTSSTLVLEKWNMSCLSPSLERSMPQWGKAVRRELAGRVKKEEPAPFPVSLSQGWGRSEVRGFHEYMGLDVC